MKKTLAVIALVVAILVPSTASAAIDLLRTKSKVAVIVDMPLMYGDEDKLEEEIIEKVNEWFPSNKYDVIDFNETRTLAVEYREENDMIIYTENTKEYKPLKITDIQEMLKEQQPDLVLNIRFARGAGKTVWTAWSRRTKINVLTDIRVLDFKNSNYVQRYQKTEAVGSGDMWGNTSASRSFRKGIVAAMEGFVPDHTKY